MSGHHFSEDLAFGVSFFERLEEGSTKKRLAGLAPDSKQVLESIKRNIKAILNTREGESLSSPELGLLDFNDATLNRRDLDVAIKESINLCLQRYEPRLKNTLVEMLPSFDSGQTLRFRVCGSINSDAIHDQVEIDVLLNSSKKYIVY